MKLFRQLTITKLLNILHHTLHHCRLFVVPHQLPCVSHYLFGGHGRSVCTEGRGTRWRGQLQTPVPDSVNLFRLCPNHLTCLLQRREVNSITEVARGLLQHQHLVRKAVLQFVHQPTRSTVTSVLCVPLPLPLSKRFFFHCCSSSLCL